MSAIYTVSITFNITSNNASPLNVNYKSRTGNLLTFYV